MAEDMQPNDNNRSNAVNWRLVNKGRGEPLKGMVQQGNVHLGLARKYAAEFAADGSWTTDETDNLARLVLTLQSDASQRLENRLGARQATVTEHQAVADSKRFIRRLRNALPRVMHAGAAHGVTMESFTVGKALGRSTPNLCSYLNKIGPALTRLDDDLQRHFRGHKPSELALSLKTTLEQADTNQEVKLAGLPLETLQFYETKGRVLEGMENLIRAARNAFEDEPMVAEQFNKNLLERARAAARDPGKAEGDMDDRGAPAEAGGMAQA